MTGYIRTSKTRCLYCSGILSAIGQTDGSADTPQPDPGDPVACIRCGAVMTVDEKRNLCPFTEQQMDELVTDKETMDALAGVVQHIHFVRHAAN